jgi:hypothetical protein
MSTEWNDTKTILERIEAKLALRVEDIFHDRLEKKNDSIIHALETKQV